MPNNEDHGQSGTEQSNGDGPGRDADSPAEVESSQEQHYRILMRLAKSKPWASPTDPGSLQSVLEQVTEAASHTLGIERVNVWLFDQARTRIRCIEHYQRSTKTHSAGGVELAAADYPGYFAALDRERTIVANDAINDPRTREFAVGYLDVHGITSMLDAPLHAGGEVIGIVCHEHVGPPRAWTADEQQFAASLADIAALALESAERARAEEALRELNADLEQRVMERTAALSDAVQEKEHLLDKLEASSVELVNRLFELERQSETIRMDLERAQIIQRALLPQAPPSLDGVHIDTLYRPGKSVGGDLYDIVAFDDHRIGFYVADAAGHGVTAAMLSVLFQQRLELREGNEILSPAEVLRRVNERLFDDVVGRGLFLTVVYVLLDSRSREITLASAGHTPVVVRRGDGATSFLERTGPALGIKRSAQFTEHRLRLDRADRVLLYTDGLLDGVEAQGEELIELFRPALTGDAERSPERLRQLFDGVKARSAVAEEAGRDDVTLLLVEASGGPSHLDNDAEVADEEAPGPGQRTRALWLAESDDETHLAVRGSGTWVHCETFRRLAEASLDRGKSLIVDLADCTHLDSTFLGTLHEVVTGHPEAGTPLRNPCESVRALFEELGLDHVLDAVDEQHSQPPCDPVPVVQEAPLRETQQRLLRAHEILSELSDENRRRFAGVVAALRAELADGEGDR